MESIKFKGEVNQIQKRDSCYDGLVTGCRITNVQAIMVLQASVIQLQYTGGHQAPKESLRHVYSISHRISQNVGYSSQDNRFQETPNITLQTFREVILVIPQGISPRTKGQTRTIRVTGQVSCNYKADSTCRLDLSIRLQDEGLYMEWVSLQC